MKYKIVERGILKDCENEVNVLLSEGWELQGGVCQMAKPIISLFGCDGSNDYYCQAMINREQPTERNKEGGGK